MNNEPIYRLVWPDGGQLLLVADDDAQARRKRELYAPFSHVRIEVSRDGGPWVLVDPGCATCPDGESMRDLGTACSVSCGVTE